MKNIALALAALAVIAGSSVRAQTVETAPAAQAGVEAAPAGQKQVLDMPAHKSRRRMLFDFGLFGCGMHVGWMKPRSSVDAQVSDHRMGKPILNVSAGTHALGVGRN